MQKKQAHYNTGKIDQNISIGREYLKKGDSGEIMVCSTMMGRIPLQKMDLHHIVDSTREEMKFHFY